MVSMTRQFLDSADNYVLLRGSLAAEPLVRTLPSGDELCSFRLTVQRPAETHRRARSDSIDCASTRAAVRRTVARCSPGQRLEVAGSLRRRFWRSIAGTPASRYEVEVIDIQRLRADTSTGARPGRPARARASGGQ
jgi:single-strand DNA-binding protein